MLVKIVSSPNKRESAKRTISILYHYRKNLEKYGSPKFRDIAKKVGLSEATVRYHIKKWKEEEEERKKRRKLTEEDKEDQEMLDEHYAMVYKEFAEEIGIPVEDLLSIIEEWKYTDVFDVWYYLSNLAEDRDGAIHDIAEKLKMKPKEVFQLYKTNTAVKRLVDGIADEFCEKIDKFATDRECRDFWEEKVSEAAMIIFNFLSKSR